MSVIIHIDVPKLLPNLLTGLEAVGCSVQAVGPRACRVVHQQAVDADEAVCELWFFARAWANREGGVAVSLQPEA